MDWLKRHQDLVLVKIRNPQVYMPVEMENELKAIREMLDCQTELAALNKLVREMVPHLKYLANIPYMDTVSWAPGKQTKRAINALLNRPEVKKILEAK